MYNNRPIISMKTTTPIRIPAPSRTATTQFGLLKKSIQTRLARELRHVMPDVLIRRALDEASDVAERTGFPLLVFPVLAEETIQRVRGALGDDSSAVVDDSATMAACA